MGVGEMGIYKSMAPFDTKRYINEKREFIDSYLKSYFDTPLSPSILHEAMKYSIFAGGKRIRPILVLASYEACGGDAEDIIPQAAALELIHTYSLIHDDLPAMDDDELRRGKPTNHKVFGEAMAILAGDALLTEAFKMISECGMHNAEFKNITSFSNFKIRISKSAILKVIREVAIAAGAYGMVAGQAQDIISEDSRPEKETLEFIHLHKTAALIQASVKIGPILAGSKKSILNAMEKYGEAIGLAFQIIDDILDIEGKTEEIGKTSGSDLRKKKVTYPALYGLEKARQKAEDLISMAIDSLKIFSHEADPLREIALHLLKRRA
jgi:geranylgeranyl diphosphate synthase, type II